MMGGRPVWLKVNRDVEIKAEILYKKYKMNNYSFLIKVSFCRILNGYSLGLT